MVTDDERREVAERLRSVAREVDRGGFSETIKHVKLAVFEDLDRYRPNGTLDRLADLIEPSGHECVPGECPLNVRHDNDRIDRDELLEAVKELERCAWYFGLDFDEDEPLRDRLKEASEAFSESARRIREALGVQDA